MTLHKRHVSDDRLIDLCLDREPTTTETQHLDLCPACQERHAALVRLLADVSTTANTSADELFTADRLDKQHARILLRIDREGRPGRLIAFPAGHAPGAALRTRPAMRWIVGAAVAGLVVGLVAGHLPHDLPRRSVPAPQIAVRPAAASLQTASTAVSEEEFLGLIEMAIEGTSGSTLSPLDDLTPLVSEVAAQ